MKDRTNAYSKILHENAIDNIIYAFPYDDVYGADPTISWKLSDVNSINIKIDKLWHLSVRHLSVEYLSVRHLSDGYLINFNDNKI